MRRSGSNDAHNMQCPGLRAEHAGSALLDERAHLQTQVAREVLCECNLYNRAAGLLWQPPLYNRGMLCRLGRIIAVEDQVGRPVIVSRGLTDWWRLHN